MLSFECTESYNWYRRQLIGGAVTSIWQKDSSYSGTSSYPDFGFKYKTAEFCDFEKNILENSPAMAYHLSGYGLLENEALSSFLGESSERYAFASISKTIASTVVVATRGELVSKWGEQRVCPLHLVNGYIFRRDMKNELRDDDKIRWVKMNSLIRPGDSVYLPLQFIMSGTGSTFLGEKKFAPPAVSTGTASQETVLKSLENSVIEFLQINSFNLWWYAGIAGVRLETDLRSLFERHCGNENKIESFLDHFDIRLTDISFDKDIDVVVCEAIGKTANVPQYVVGVQGALNLETAEYRSVMECLAVIEYAFHVPWTNRAAYESVTADTRFFGNLDDNVIFYSKYGKEAFPRVERESPFTRTKKTYHPIATLSDFSWYAGFLDITLPEFSGLNFAVTRVCIPELLPMCLPSYPQACHPRYKTAGGIINDAPHPLA
ncbi:MAG: YcaO-like family protein [Aeriscardovia sp.]|nr:YcaO-like family protein [Aeriscardovia sp.]